ncbi:diaminopropionate ammonia-lyase family [Cedecea neteri]|uniref:Diaminopropionate ammonia-lyase family n=1 Tax=Cedecea neteri TaxID=158822 RepID=A0A2X3J062_9ENTR|nr:diaminopropionate ammonia-lyase family [Cedecea neteri]
MLGGSYAIAQLLCEKYQLNIDDLSLEDLKTRITEKMTFATTHRRQPRTWRRMGGQAAWAKRGGVHA